MDSLGQRLRKARERMKLNQTDVQKRTGINNKTLSRYENDGTEPDSESLRKLSELYGVSADWIIGNKKESVYTLPESEIYRVIKEAEAHYGVSLHDDPMVLASMKQIIQMLAQAKKDKEENQ